MACTSYGKVKYIASEAEAIGWQMRWRLVTGKQMSLPVHRLLTDASACLHNRHSWQRWKTISGSMLRLRIRTEHAQLNERRATCVGPLSPAVSMLSPSGAALLWGHWDAGVVLEPRIKKGVASLARKVVKSFSPCQVPGSLLPLYFPSSSCWRIVFYHNLALGLKNGLTILMNSFRSMNNSTIPNRVRYTGWPSWTRWYGRGRDSCSCACPFILRPAYAHFEIIELTCCPGGRLHATLGAFQLFHPILPSQPSS